MNIRWLLALKGAQRDHGTCFDPKENLAMNEAVNVWKHPITKQVEIGIGDQSRMLSVDQAMKLATAIARCAYDAATSDITKEDITKWEFNMKDVEELLRKELKRN